MSGELTLGRWIRDRARTTPDRVAIDYGGERTTYQELDQHSERLAAGFLAAGLCRGDRVATLTGSSPGHAAVFFACAKAGLLLLPLSWRLSSAELAYQLDDAEPALLLVEEEHDALADAALAAAAVAPRRERLGAVPPPGDALGAEVGDDDPLLLVYTSGTTGRPKGALLTHRNCFWTNLSFDLGAGIAGDDVVLQVLPQFHVGGWNVQPLLAWWKGATVVLERFFDPARCLALIAEKRVTTMMGVPATYLFMSQQPAFDCADLSSLRRAVVGGAPMPEALLAAWQERGDGGRPGLRPHGGGAERPLPARRGRLAQARLRRQALSARRGRLARPGLGPPARRAPPKASSSCAARTSSGVTGGTRRRRLPPSLTAGSSPATSASGTGRATTGSAAA